jgi:uncharacterized membrane protein
VSVLQGLDVRGRRTLVAGGLLLGVLVLVLGSSLIADRTLFTKLTAVIAATFFGGRMTGILTGLELDLGPITTAAVMMLFNTAWLLLMLPFFASLSNRAARRGRLTRFFAPSRDRTGTQARTIEAFGTWALPVFIWLPFPLTGAFAGAAIGLLLGMAWRRLLIVVLSSMWIGITSWSFGIDYLILFTGTTGRIVCWVVTGAVVLYTLASRWRHTPEGR